MRQTDKHRHRHRTDTDTDTDTDTRHRDIHNLELGAHLLRNIKHEIKVRGPAHVQPLPGKKNRCQGNFEHFGLPQLLGGKLWLPRFFKK